jgi:toxin ParE1/3/4
LIVRWTEPAVTDLTGICDYVQQHDGSEAALRIALRIYHALDALSAFPRRGRSGRRVGTRELLFPGLPYVAIYRIKEATIEINRILHGAQKWP